MVGFKKERDIVKKKKIERDRGKVRAEPNLCLVFKPFLLQGKKGIPSLSHVAFIIVSTPAFSLGLYHYLQGQL